MQSKALLKSDWLVALALAAATAAVFWEVTGHPFVNYDDNLYVTDCLQVSRGLTWDNVCWAFRTTIHGNWIPLTWLTHILDYQLYGLNAGGHHLTSLLIHILNTVLLYLLLNKLTGAMWKSALVAGLFALHPLNVESVAWVAERKNVLCMLFWILAIWGYAWYAARPGWKRYAVALLLFGMGLMAKSMVVTLPFVLLLLDYWPLGRLQTVDPQPVAEADSDGGSRPKASPGRGRVILGLVLEKVPLLILAIADALITIKVQVESQSVATTRGILPGMRIRNALVSYVAYLEKTVWPAKLAVFYPHPKSNLQGWRVGVALLVLACATGLVIWGWRRFRYLGVGWLWFLGTLVPVIGLIQAGAQSMADRYAYLPLVGIFVAVVWGLSELVDHYKRARDYVIVGGVCAIFALVIVTRVQLSHWSSSIDLWVHAEQVTENNYIAYNNLGEALWSQGDMELAAPWFYKSVEAYPDLSNSHLNLGMVLVHTGQLDEGIAHLSRAIELDSQSFDAYNKLGAAFGRKGQIEDAIRCFQISLIINRRFADALANLGIEFENEGKYEDASALFEKAIQCALNPDMSMRLHVVYGDLLVKQGELARAAGHYREALRLRPGYAPALQALDKIQAGGG